MAVIAELGRQLEAVRGNQTLGATADNLNAALNSVTQTLHAAGLNSPADLQAQLSQLELGSTPWQMPAARSPTAFNFWWIRPRSWEVASTRPQRFC